MDARRPRLPALSRTAATTGSFTPPAGPARRRALGVGFTLALLSAGAIATPQVVVAASAPPSAVGDEAILSLQVSPAYTRTGLVVAVTATLNQCSKDCVHVWVTRDGGSAWHRATAIGFEGGHPLVIGLDKPGAEHLYAGTSSGVQRSDDFGETWTGVGGGGIAAVALTSAGESAITVAGGGAPDYMLESGTSRPISGSGGKLQDVDVMLAPSFPAAGSHPPALLAGIDPSTGLPVLQRCSADLSCSGAITLAGATRFTSPVTLAPSSDYAGDGVVFAQTGTGIYKSVDGGTSYAPLAPAPSGGDITTATPMIALASGYREAGPVRMLYAAVIQVHSKTKPGPGQSPTFGDVYRSDDAGASWKPFGTPGPFDAGAMAVAVAPTGRVFGGYIDQGFGGLLCNDGGGWQPSCPAQGGGGSVTQPVGASAATHPVTAAGSGASACSGCRPASGGAAPAQSPGGGTAAAGSGSAGGASAAAPGAGAAAPATTAPGSTASAGGRGPGVIIAVIAVAVLAGLAGLRIATRSGARSRPR